MEGKIALFGSYLAGLFVKGERIPVRAETVLGDEFREGPGGKGSNQAVAAACFGADVSFIGRIGRDRRGDEALAMYGRFGVRTANIVRDAVLPTGVSVIMVDRNGDNVIMSVPGASAAFSAADVDVCADLLRTCDYVGFQCENNPAVVAYGIRRAHESGAKVLLDPSPVCSLPDDLYPLVSIIKPNEVEASALSGIRVVDSESAAAAGRWFLAKGVETAVITLGERGVVRVGRDGARRLFVSRLPSPPVDSTGAGDVLAGALLAHLAQDDGFDEALRFAVAASALSVTSFGVVEAIPAVDAIRRILGDVRICAE